MTLQINGLVELARKENDYITINFLQWFLTEQLEEVSSMDNLLKILERAGNDLLQADEYLARVGVRAIPTPPKESNFGGRRPPLQSEDGMSFKDHFSKQAADYAKFRPRYPRELFEYLGNIAPSRQLAWDCGTGNGQASVGLATAFDRVIATDASEKQIANAQPHERVEYRAAPAESSGIASETVDLIMVAQVLHWFDLDRFYDEVRRVLKKNSVLAASAYNLLHIEPAIDEVINRYYYEVVGPYWLPERKLVENFAELPFPFHELDLPDSK